MSKVYGQIAAKMSRLFSSEKLLDLRIYVFNEIDLNKLN